jgi:TetR/AcrR family transcriptional regulator, transcriptional repressor for nem operon
MCVMRISRQSMYDTFGDKRTLFLQALELYVMESVRSTQAELKKAERITTPKGKIVR